MKNINRSEAEVSTKKIPITFNSIDLMKFIMAYAVIAIHTGPLNDIKNGFIFRMGNEFLELAVPFYFLTSGFLMAKKMNYPFDSTDKNIVKTQLYKLTRLYITWMIIYTPLAIYKFIIDKTGLFKSIAMYVRGLLFNGQQYNSWHLWYLLSTVYALLVILFSIKRGISPAGMIMVSAIFIMLSTMTDLIVYNNSNMPLFFEIARKLLKYSIGDGRIFRGMIYIPIGMMLANKSISLPINWLILLSGLALNYYIDVKVLNNIVVVFTAIGLFGIVEKISLKDSFLFPLLRKMGVIIYLIHMYVWSFYYFIVYRTKTSGIDSFLVTSIVTTVIALAYLNFSEYTKKKEG